MYPDLLGVFGVTLYGAGFERLLWGLLALLMVWGIISSILIFRKGRRYEGGIQGIIVLVILIWAASRFVSTFSPDYALVFNEPLVLHTYAFCVLIGVVCGTLTAMKMAAIRGREPREMLRLCVFLVLFGFLGARAAHVIVDNSTYWNACFHPEAIGADSADCLRILNFAEGGLTFYGGVIAGLIIIALFMFRRYRRGVPVEALSVMDVLGGALAVSHAFGRLGCLAAGCCWGAVTTGTIGVRYGRDSFAFAELVKDPQFHDTMMKTGETPIVHATQLYESLGEFAIYGVLWIMLIKKVKHGRMAGTWLIGYGVLRFIVEMMRDDSERGYYFEYSIQSLNSFLAVPPEHATILSTSQGIALGMIVMGIVVLVISARAKQTDCE
jgi:phosphatidylglycerol:prolipoprotein diacylglycerol transferase